jgi:hypothetical protein
MVFNGLETKTWDSIVLGHAAAIMLPPIEAALCPRRKESSATPTQKPLESLTETSQMFTVDLLCRQYNLLFLNTFYLQL